MHYEVSMNRKFRVLRLIIVITSIFLSACGSLIKQVENAVREDYGPTYTAQERQTRTFEALWKYLTQNYIYYDSEHVNWKALHDKYSAQIKPDLTDKQFNDLINQLAAELPQGTLSYESRDERIKLDAADNSSYEGIGAIINFRPKEVPHIVILDVLAGSPAEKAGIKPHDSIYAIDGSPVLLEEGLNVVDRVRGPAGSQVILQVKTPGKDVRNVQVTRGKLVSSGKLTAYKVTGTNFGYILIPPINYTNLQQDVANALKDFATSKKLNGLIIDLRVANSSGGFPLENLLSLFQDGKIGEFYDNAKETQALSVQGQNIFDSQTVPLVVLIGDSTSGFAEILAASLQAGNRATLIGQATTGSVENSSAFYLPDGSRVIIQTSSFRLANGTEIGINGVKPDITVDAGWDDVLPNADPVFDQAIKTLDKQK